MCPEIPTIFKAPVLFIAVINPLIGSITQIKIVTCPKNTSPIGVKNAIPRTIIEIKNKDTGK